MNERIDLFIPTVSNHVPYLGYSLSCAFFQTYKNIRVVLWVDDCNEAMQVALDKYWYTPEDADARVEYDSMSPEYEQALSLFWKKDLGPAKENSLKIEHCSKGILVRNSLPRTGRPDRAWQWFFGWGGKSEWAKFMGDDDILLPSAMRIMASYISDGIDGVIHPMIQIGGHRLGSILKGDPKGLCGTGAMMLHKSFMEGLIKEGFMWTGGDGCFYNFVKSRNANFVTTKENALYLYLKNGNP
jgi:hypothetical protein